MNAPMKNPLISLIVPVYNYDVYECVNSIINQTYTNYELIIVNDGSSINCFDRIKDVIFNKENIYLVNKDNAGVSSARNLGLKLAKGEWVGFIDADDIVDKNYLKNLIEGTYIDDEIDLVISGFKTFGYSDSLSNMFNDMIYSHESLGSFFSKMLKRIALGVPWGKLYKKSIIDNNNIQFDTKIKFNEDYLFNHKYFLYVNKIRTLSCQDYMWRIENCKYKYATNIDEYVYALNTLTKQYLELTDKYHFINKEYIYGVFSVQTIRLLSFEGVYNKFKMSSYKEFKHQFRKILIYKDFFVSNGKVFSILFYFIRHELIFPLFVYARVINPLKSAIKKIF